MKTQTKTSLLLLSAFLVIVMIFSGFVYFSVANYSYKDFYKLLEIRAFTTARVELHRGFDTEVTEINALHNEFFDKLPQEHDYFFPLTPAKTFEEEAKTLKLPITFFETIRKEGKTEYSDNGLFYVGIKYNSPKGEYIVVASAENYFELHHFVYLRKTLFLAIATAFLFSLFISVYFSKYVFNPLTKIRMASTLVVP